MTKREKNQERLDLQSSPIACRAADVWLRLGAMCGYPPAAVREAMAALVEATKESPLRQVKP